MTMGKGIKRKKENLMDVVRIDHIMYPPCVFEIIRKMKEQIKRVVTWHLLKVDEMTFYLSTNIKIDNVTFLN